PLWNICFHNIACLEPHEAYVTCAICFGKAVLIGSTHLTRTMPYRFDLKWLNILYFQVLRRALPDACGVNPMRFKQLSLYSIEFGQASRPRFNRQIERSQAIEERPPCRIDGGGVFQGCLRLSFDVRKINAAKL